MLHIVTYHTQKYTDVRSTMGHSPGTINEDKTTTTSEHSSSLSSLRYQFNRGYHYIHLGPSCPCNPRHHSMVTIPCRTHEDLVNVRRCSCDAVHSIVCRYADAFVTF